MIFDALGRSRWTLVAIWMVFGLLPGAVLGQVTITGSVTDNFTGESLIGVNVVLKGTTTGAVTDIDGNFSLQVESLPVTLVVSYIGYNSTELVVNDASSKIKFKLDPSETQLKTVEIVDSRLTKKQEEAPTTIEAMDIIAIKETPAANFYDGLGNLKGVDLTAASMGFKIINTRGFNSTRPVRTLQTVDGVDNQAPGLNFSVGNFAGSSELDVQKVEIIVGANSALYGPNAFNGVIAMTTKSPWIHQGLSVMGKVGERNLSETAVRYAKAFKLKEKDFFAFKLNFSYMQADDWEADNYDPTEQSSAGLGNWGGYDGVNIYGDEFRLGNISLANQRNTPGLGYYYRTGYQEKDLVDYDTRNMKISPSLHFMLTQKIEAKYTFNYGTGTTVYQGDNRYSLKDLEIRQHIVEVSQKDKWFVRAYNTNESAGKSYDAVFAAILLQDLRKGDVRWAQDYNNYYNSFVVDSVRALEGFPDPFNPNSPSYFLPNGGGPNLETYALADQVMNDNADLMQLWHDQARNFADTNGSDVFLTFPRFIPGTAPFDSALASITSRQTFTEGGAGFFDQSSLNHIQGQYMFQPEFADIILGANFRQYNPISNGTIFLDTGNVKITNREFGAYTSVSKRVMDESLILTFSGRADKNENFDWLFSPALSGVYRVNEKSTVRLSFSSAIRNPTLQDQYLFYNVGRALLIGNLNGIDSLVTTESLGDYYSELNADTLSYFNVRAVRPERVQTVEVGFKGTVLRNLFIDASYYYSWYQDLLGFKIGAEVGFDTNGFLNTTQVYRVSANSDDQVTTQGFSVGLNYYFKKYYSLNGNYSWNVLNRQGSDDPIIPAFNTPEHKYNVGISGRDMIIKLGNTTIKNLGFNVTYKWVQGFLFEGSPQFTGEIPTYDMVDAQVNYKWAKAKTTFKLGASNLFNQMNFQTYGGPRIGRLAYFSVLFELDKI
ncbi:MAG: TonB-dependent receptor domain-containing protein [Salibacteraceae bacterium]